MFVTQLQAVIDGERGRSVEFDSFHDPHIVRISPEEQEGWDVQITKAMVGMN